MKIWFSVDLKIVFFFLFQQASLLLALINMFLQFGKSINPSNLLYSGQVGNDILTSHILIQSHYLLLSELYTDFKNLETLSCNASILITVHPSFVFFFSTGYHTAIACSDSDFVCTVDALTETFLSSTPAQHQKARGKRRTWFTQLLTLYFWVLGYPVLVTAVYWSKVLNFILISFSKEILAM